MTGQRAAYVRVSTLDQNTVHQLDCVGSAASGQEYFTEHGALSRRYEWGPYL